MKENKTLYKIAKAIYSKLLKIIYRPTVKETENIPEKGAIIFVGNHKHAFDPIMVMSNTNRTIHYMAKESLFKGIHGKILESIGTIKIHKDPELSTHQLGNLSPLKNRLWRFFKLRSNQGFPVHVITRGIGDNMYRKTHLAIKKMKGF